MRTQKEIVERIRAVRGEDMFGFKGEVLVRYLDFEHASEFLSEYATEEKWGKTPRTHDPLEELTGYMVFAWDKALNHRRLSAGRSIQKIEEWVWLMGADALLSEMGNTPHMNYGAPILRLVCEQLELPWPDSDTAAVNMSEGRTCEPGCAMGCGE